MCVLSSSYPLPTRTILSLSAMSSRHWIDRVAVDWLARPNAWSILVWIVRTSLCSHQKGICALLYAVAAHAVVCNAFFSFSQVLWEEKARETLRSFTSWDSSCPLRSGETICLIFGCNLSKRETPRQVILTVTWVQSYRQGAFAWNWTLQGLYKIFIFYLSKNYKLIINRLRK